MWSQARNDRKIVRAIPAAPNTTYVITRSRIVMTITDVNLSAEHVWSTWCARRQTTLRNKCGPRSAHVDKRPKIQGMRYVAHTWQLNLSGNSILANPWRLTHLLLSLNYFKTRPLKLNSTYSFFFIQAGFMSSITFMFSFFLFFSI